MEVITTDGKDKECTSENINNEENVVEAEDATISPNYYFWKYEIPPECSPKCMITTKNEEFHKSEKNKKAAKYMKGCKW